MGEKKETSTSTARSEQNPWSPTMPLLNDVLGQLKPQIGNSGLNSTETGALNNLTENAQGGNPYSGQIGMLANDLLSGGNDRTGIVNDSYTGLKNSLSPFASGDYVNPNSNPALQGYLSTIGNDVTNRIRSQFAAAGRGFSGAETGSIARGVAEGTAPVLANAYENERGRQMGAVQGLYSGGMNTASALSGLDQTALGNRQAGVGASVSAQQAKDSGAERLLQIEAQKRGIPLQNLGMLSNMLIPMAQLGGTVNSTQTTERTGQQPLGSQILGGVTGGLGLLGQTGAFGPAGWLLGGSAAGAAGAGTGVFGSAAGSAGALAPMLAMSDRRLKSDIRQIGVTSHDLPYYEYTIFGQRKRGVMADEVERIIPDAVVTLPNGYRAVDYGMIGVEVP